MFSEFYLYAIVALVVLIVLTFIGLMSRYRKCPSNKMLIVFGKAGKDSSGNSVPAKIIHGGGCFVWPIIQDYEYLSTLPIQISTQATDILSEQNINVSFPVNLTVAIDTSSEAHKQAAASRLLGIPEDDLKVLLTNNLLGGLRAVVATLKIEEVNKDRNKFLEAAAQAIAPSLDELGLKIIDLNMEDLSDNDHYLENLSKKAVTKAESEAKADIAEMERDGAIKEAAARKEMETTVGKTNQEKDIQLAEIERIKAEKTAEIEKLQKTSVANQQAEQRAAVAKANTEAQKAEALAIADADKATAAADADAKAAIAAANAESEAKQAKSNAEAEAKKAEAEATKQTRIAEAKALQDTASQKAQQEKDAQIAEFEANKRKRAAIADQEAKVTQQQAFAAIATAEGEAEKTKQEAQKLAGMAKVEAELAVAKQRQERQLEVNNAEAAAEAARLNATTVVPAEAAKKVAEIKAGQEKSIKVINAEGEAESLKKEAVGKAEAIKTVAVAQAEATKLQGEAEAAATQAKLEAQYNAEVNKAKGISEAEVAGIVQLSEKLGDPQAAVQFFLRDVNRDIKVAEAYAGSLHEVMGNVTVYGDSNTAGNFASSLLSMIPQIRQVGQTLKEGVKVVKESWKGESKEAPVEEAPAAPVDDINNVGASQFEDVH